MNYFHTLSRGEMPKAAIWLPLLDELAAQIEACEVGALLADATRWANAMPRIAKLVHARIIAVGFHSDHCLAAFASSPDEPWQHDGFAALLECTRRLAETARPERELAVALPGPARILRSLGLSGERASMERIKPGLVKLLEMIGECRPDLLVIDEACEGDVLLGIPDYRRICGTLKNVTSYFGIPLAMRISGYEDGPATIREMRSLRLEHLMLGVSATGRSEVAEILAAASGLGWQSLGLPWNGTIGRIELAQTNPASYWCSPEQEIDLEQARTTGQALAV